MLPFIMLFFNLGCKESGENTPRPILPATELKNVSYGNDAEQLMDVYLPAGRDNNTTKVFILMHGGGWSGGSKAGLDYVIPLLKSEFPDHAIVNMDYRLATMDSPAFPKQVQDIEKAIQFLKDSDYQIANEYAFIGASAGAHLAMLYSYKYDTAREVKAVCSIVGPSDFTDPFYTSHPYYNYVALYLFGDIDNHDQAATGISPALHVDAQSPPTILFYGGQDMLIPVSQATRLKAQLDTQNIYNEYYLYKNGGHGNWNSQVMSDFKEKLIKFFKDRF